MLKQDKESQIYYLPNEEDEEIESLLRVTKELSAKRPCAPAPTEWEIKERSKINAERFAKQREEAMMIERLENVNQFFCPYKKHPKVINKRQMLASMGVKNPDQWLKDYAKNFK